MYMNTTTNTAEMAITKGDGRYNITVNGTYVGHTYKQSDGRWTVRIATTEGYDFENGKAVVLGEVTRKDALSGFAFWLSQEPYYMYLRQEREAKDASADAWLATV